MVFNANNKVLDASLIGSPLGCMGYDLTCVITVRLQDLRYFKSQKTSRGILQEGWRDTQDPIMCSYKLVTVKFEVWGLQTRVEQFVHKVRRQARDECRPFVIVKLPL